MRCVDVGAKSKQAVSGSHASSTATHPVGETRLDELDTDEHNGRASDNWWQDLQQELCGDKRDEDVDQSTHSGGTENGSITLRARQGVSIRIRRTETIGVHLSETSLSDRYNAE